LSTEFSLSLNLISFLLNSLNISFLALTAHCIPRWSRIQEHEVHMKFRRNWPFNVWNVYIFGWMSGQTQGFLLGFQSRNHRDPNKQNLPAVKLSYCCCLSHVLNTCLVYMDRPKEMFIKEVTGIRILLNVKVSIKGSVGNFPIHIINFVPFIISSSLCTCSFYLFLSSDTAVCCFSLLISVHS
jgi:hypothetical protein